MVSPDLLGRPIRLAEKTMRPTLVLAQWQPLRAREAAAGLWDCIDALRLAVDGAPAPRTFT